MLTINEPEKFRDNVKLVLSDILDNFKYANNLEKGIYNYTIQKADENNIIKKWNNTYFAQLYVDKFRSIYNNLKLESVKNLITNKEIKPHELAFMSHQKMLPNKWNPLIEEIKIKNQNKYTPRLEASTDNFECNKCRQIESKKAKLEKREIKREEYTKCTYFQLQTRSADEPMTTFVTCLNCNSRWKC